MNVAHCPESGVKVYVENPVTEVSITGGCQLPVIPFVEIKGRAGGTEFSHSGATISNSGTVSSSTSIGIVITEAH